MQRETGGSTATGARQWKHSLVVMASSIALAAGCTADDSEPREVICSLTVEAVQILVDEMRNGESLSEILSVLEPVADKLCVEVIEFLVSAPTSTTVFNLEGPSGLERLTTTGTELVAPAPPPPADGSTLPGPELERVIACGRGFDNKVLFDACTVGVIDPPVDFFP